MQRIRTWPSKHSTTTWFGPPPLTDYIIYKPKQDFSQIMKFKIMTNEFFQCFGSGKVKTGSGSPFKKNGSGSRRIPNPDLSNVYLSISFEYAVVICRFIGKSARRA